LDDIFVGIIYSHSFPVWNFISEFSIFIDRQKEPFFGFFSRQKLRYRLKIFDSKAWCDVYDSCSIFGTDEFSSDDPEKLIFVVLWNFALVDVRKKWFIGCSF